MAYRAVVIFSLVVVSACQGTAPTSTPADVIRFTSPAPAASSPAPEASPTRETPSPSCVPTHDDEVSPSYKPNTPVRSVVGHGHVLTGVVLSSKDCRPIAHAQLEFWPEEGTLGHPDSSRATLFTEEDGRYRFECNPPDHIHMRISATGFHTIGVNSYHPNGRATGTLDMVLVPE